jgi:hypothetical protein
MLPTTALVPTAKRRTSAARILALPAILFFSPAPVVLLGADPTPSAHLGSFVKQYCANCHGAEKQEAKVALHALGDRPRSEVELAIWKRALGQLESRHMPPDDAQQPSIDERRIAIGGLYAGLERVGIVREGNEVDHDALFAATSPAGSSPSGAPMAPSASTEGRIWRLSQPAYEAYLREGFRGVKSASRVRAPWEMAADPKTGFSDFASSHRIGEAELEHHLRNILPMVREMTAHKSPAPELAALAKAGKTASAAQLDAAVASLFRRFLKREPTDAERPRYAGFLQKNLAEHDSAVAIEQAAMAVLLHPESLYRVEAAERERLLAPHHLARALAYTLTDQGPDVALAAAAAENKLRTPEEVRTHVLRMLDDPLASKLRILRFFQEYFGYTAAPDVFKDAPTLAAAQVVEDAKVTRKETEWAEASYTFVRDLDWLVLNALEKDRDVLRRLLTTRETFTLTKPERGPRPLSATEVQHAKTKYRDSDYKRGFFRTVPVELRIYELDELAIRRDAWAPDRTYEMPAGHRAGVLTHPAWLISRSGNFDNDPIHRGKWIRETLLGQKLPEIPITVDARLPDEPEHTLRHRMRVTRETYCWKCHEQMDPLGLPFEMFDHFGRYREAELGKPVDAVGYLSGTGDPKLDRPVRNAVELIERLAQSKRVEQVFVRHVFRYFIGRNETLVDGPVLVEAHRAYAESGGSMRALLASLLTSPAFLERALLTKHQP